MPDPYLTIVVPAYNEARRIGPTLQTLIAYASSAPRPVEILVVDDGSTDGTGELARRAGVAVHPVTPNRGKGHAIRQGVLAARGEVVLVSDADLSTPIQDADRLLAQLARMGHGLVIGSRDVGDSKVEVHQNMVRELMGKCFNLVVRLLTGLPFHDTQCGFKLMTRADVVPIFQKARIDGFGYDVELIYVAMRRGIPIREVGVTWRNAPGSKVGMLSDPLKMLRDVWRIRRWYRKGAYDAAG